MWLKSISKKQLISALIGVYLASVIWIALLSRIGSGYRNVYYPFQSYVNIYKGDFSALIENVGNVILFIPFGIIIGAFRKINVKRTTIFGFTFSFCIEILQFLLFLGTFEFGDLTHNTLGTVLGFVLVQKSELRIDIAKQQLRMIVVGLVVALAIPPGYQYVHYLRMADYAALHDREDGAKNLLVLNGKNGFAWNTRVYIKYLPEGSISIKGQSNKTSWWPIADVELKPGVYSLSGLSGTRKNSVGVELEINKRRFTSYIGPVEEVQFRLEESTKFKAYVIVYPGCDCDAVATPVIYKEE